MPKSKTITEHRLKIERKFTKEGTNPLDEVEYETRSSKITEPDGKIIFEASNLEAPKSWSQLAVDIAASKYFKRAQVPNTELGKERSVKEMVSRVSTTLRLIGEEYDYFESEQDAQAFEDELSFMLVNQYGAFNSPVWFNCGLFHKYGIRGSKPGTYFYNLETNHVEECEDPYSHPQASACFIQKIEDSLDSIYELVTNESKLFKFGSGTGSNFSSLRAAKEKLSGGGFSSGLMSFLKILDRSAAAVKSGGITRRAAKMCILDMDHPEIEDYIMWKVKEENKVRALIKAGYSSDFNGEAYQTISGQNSNNSVMIADKFIQAVLEDKDWQTIERTTGKVSKTYKARDLMNMISKAAWRCADPGVMFYDTMNKWHTCKNTEHIHATNPCGEYIFIDDSACNLASLNLMKFMKEDAFDIKAFRYACKIFTIAQEILVDFASYPTKKIAKNSHDFRAIGLGHANLGTLLMTEGISYDSDKGRAIASAITAILTGHTYRTSAEIAKIKNPFEKFEENKEPMLEVMKMHRDSAYKIDVRHCPSYLLDAAREDWDKVVELGEKYGFRNAQATVIAPTGTIGFLMDCDTTGIEPEFALIKWKKLAGGGYFKIVNKSIEHALEKLGHKENEIKEIIDYILENGNIENAPHIKKEHVPAFDCANKNPGGSRFIQPMGHVKMIAAVQPFVAGAISKTVNIPNNATVEDIQKIYFEAWRLGLKGIALYRDGCKLSQPLSTELEGKEQKKETTVERGTQKKMPYKRKGITVASKISGNKLFIRTGEYEDSKLGEIFIDMHKAGSSFRSLMSCFAIAVSMGLQYGVPLEKYVNLFTFTRFEPSGLTDHPNIRSATSVIDFIFRVLGMEYLGRTDFVHMPPVTEQETTQEPRSEKEIQDKEDKKEVQTKLPNEELSSKEKQLSSLLGDAPLCDQCGHTTIRNGSCYKCLNCGNSMGCS
ncbi:MAG: vitamin B12-dependent ribonucleotide reductase [Candidatus Woesearchaeota archaeon]